MPVRVIHDRREGTAAGRVIVPSLGVLEHLHTPRTVGSLRPLQRGAERGHEYGAVAGVESAGMPGPTGTRWLRGSS